MSALASWPNHHTHHNPLSHTPHHHKSTRILMAVHIALDEETERRRVFEASYKEMVDQVLDFIVRYRWAPEDTRTHMLQSEELRTIIGQAHVFLQPNHGIPCSNRDNLSIIISRLDYVLKNRLFWDIHIIFLMIQFGVGYVRTHHEPNPIDSRSLRDGAERIQKLAADPLLQSV